MQQILTANRLSNDKTVWLAADHSWAERIEDAEIAHDEATVEKLTRAGRAALLKHEVAGVDLIDIEIVAGGACPSRPRARAAGELYGGNAKAA